MKYFAYGTLLNLETMLKTAPSAKSLGVMRLDGYSLAFSNCADGKTSGCTLAAATDAITYGVLYDLSEHDMEKMDAGAVNGDLLWHHKTVKLVDDNGQIFESVTYVVAGDARPSNPTAAYVEPILKGLSELNFPGNYAADTRKKILRAQNES